MSACERALSYAKNKRIDECEVVHVKKKTITVRITDSEIAEIKQNNENLFGVRIIHKKKISTTQTTILDDSTKAVDRTLELLKYAKEKSFWKTLPSKFKGKQTIENTFDKKISEISGSEASDIAQRMINSASDPKISSVTGSLNLVSEEFEVSNTNGLTCNDKATYISATLNTDSNFGNFPVSGIGQASCRTLKNFSPERIGDDAKRMCVDSINPQKCESEFYSIIFEPYSVGEMLAFVFSTNFNLKVYSEKRSCFSNKLGQEIAVQNFTLMDDPHAPEGIGSKLFDEEGLATKPTPLIENGVLKNLYSDLYNSFKENTEPSGNGARLGSPMGRSADPIPTPSPHNLRVTSGKQTVDEIIKDTKKGLVVGRLWYTYPVNPIKGDFSCTARSGIQIIKEGQIIQPAKPVRIVHNLALFLKNISAITKEERNVLQWASLPSITPSIRVERIRVIPIE